MHIKEGLVYDKHTGELIGFTDLGDINSHLLSLEQSLVDMKPQPLATTIMTFMVRGLFSHLQFLMHTFLAIKSLVTFYMTHFGKLCIVLRDVDSRYIAIASNTSCICDYANRLHVCMYRSWEPHLMEHP